MPTPENPRGPSPDGPQVGPLPPELAAYLEEQEVCCLMQATDQGTAFVIKLPRFEIESVRDWMPVELSHELYQHPAAPVIRTLVTLYDQPHLPLALETFTNIEDPAQRAEFAALGKQRSIPLLFYDEELSPQLSKLIASARPAAIREILADADRVRAAIALDLFDFDAAKAAVMAATRL